MKKYFSIFILGTVGILFLTGGKIKPVNITAGYLDASIKYIPSGSCTLEGNTKGFAQDLAPDTLWPVTDDSGMKSSRMVSMYSFYMYDHEITNGEYVFYLNQLLKSGDKTAWLNALPDTLCWRKNMTYCEPYVEYYLRHPAYMSYPVVGVSYDQSLRFCEWLTRIYTSDPSHKIKGIKFTLPTNLQWMVAAKGGFAMVDFPWGTSSLMDKKGVWMANFKKVDQSSMLRTQVNGENRFIVGNVDGTYGSGEGTSLTTDGDITSPSQSYAPNKYGLYHMSGNVEEFILEKGYSKGGSWNDPGFYLRISSGEKYAPDSSASAERGFRFVVVVPNDKR
jgi:formylglycine-generating enzyme